MPVVRINNPTVARFERRWLDYCDVLERGTDPAVGLSEPRPPDERESVARILGSGFESLGLPTTGVPDRVQQADRALDDIWKKDGEAWPRRLQPFLKMIEPSRSFGELIAAGCQPDALAIHFHEAARREDLTKQEIHVRTELDILDKLSSEWVQLGAHYADRSRQLDEYLWAHRLRVPYENPIGATLDLLRAEVEDVVSDRQDDMRRVRRQIDRRRQPFLGHAHVRLSRQIHEVTGHYYDDQVASVLNALGGDETVTPEALKSKRWRWEKRLRRTDVPQNPDAR
jgi:hypothetical protein